MKVFRCNKEFEPSANKLSIYVKVNPGTYFVVRETWYGVLITAEKDSDSFIAISKNEIESYGVIEEERQQSIKAPKTIRLYQAKSYHYTGVFKYLVAYDYASGKKDRYTVFVLNADDPVVIGRELCLKSARHQIRRFEATALSMGYTDTNEREDVCSVLCRL